VETADRRATLERLFEAYAGAVRAYARRRVDPAAADDAVSEVFVIAWRRLDDVPDDPLPWLLGCARHVLSHQQRRLGRDVALVTRLSATARAELSVASDGTLAQAFSALSEQDRELLLLIAWEGLDIAQAAQVLGCSRNALTVRLHRARKRFAAALRIADGPGLTAGSGKQPKEASDG
jgi:RNA polymerase sigma-70 factor (ECF subfamily)